MTRNFGVDHEILIFLFPFGSICNYDNHLQIYEDLITKQSEICLLIEDG